MKHSQKSHSGDSDHNMTVVLFTLLCVLICGSLALSPKAQTKTSDEQGVTPRTVPGRNGKIAFSSAFDGNLEIYTTEADGSNVQRLTNNSGSDSGPKWSPDGTKIAFARHNSNFGEIFVMNADGSDQRRLTQSRSDHSPTWSPDGTKLAFSSRRGNNFDINVIYVMNADGSNQTELTNSGRAGSLGWSPDSSRIAFDSNRDGNSEIYVMNADGGDVQRLTNNSGFDFLPKWSPDGTRIAFVSNRDEPNPSACGNCNFEIYVMNADGSNQTRLTNNPSYDLSPEWSPDGTRIVFQSNSVDIYVMNADGSNPVR
ncbi:MAG: hypothetical protein ND866_19500, partial [Pyrinomonadaceae bacterium]|nr:hypothetical protein [Pyrinomonadaceae bacterium]